MLAVDGLGQNLGTSRFARSARAAEQIRMVTRAIGDLILQNGGDMLLPTDILKALRSPFTV
jgi:hypothetical protein